MQNNFFSEIKKPLTAASPHEKTMLFKAIYQNFLNDKYSFTRHCELSEAIQNLRVKPACWIASSFYSSQ